MNFLTSGSNDAMDALSSILPSAQGSGSTRSKFWETLSSWDSLMEFYNNNQVSFTLVVLLSVLLIVLAAWIIRKLRKRPPDPQKQIGASTLFRVAAGFLILCLATSDLFAMYNMFSNFRLKPEESVAFSLTFALFLEGFPFVLGYIDPMKKDPAQFIMQREKRYRTISIVCWIFLIVSWTLAITIRFLYTEQSQMGGFVDFWKGNYNSSRNKYSNNAYLAQVFLYVSPILTSILAYALSYMAFGSSCLQEAARVMRAAKARFEAAEQAYNSINNLRQDAKSVLWSSFTNSIDYPPPTDFDDFRNQSTVYIHDKLISGCLDAYPTLLKRYNHEVESVLARYIVELSEYSSMPQLITQITVQQITEEFDSKTTNNVNKWGYELCGPYLLADLERLLNDAVIGAQFQALSKK